MDTDKTESFKRRIADLKARRDAAADPTEREELEDAISSLAMAWQFNNATSVDDSPETSN